MPLVLGDAQYLRSRRDRILLISVQNVEASVRHRSPTWSEALRQRLQPRQLWVDLLPTPCILANQMCR